MANFGPPTAEIGSGVWGTPANFNGFVTAATLLTGGQPNLARCLAVCWAGTQAVRSASHGHVKSSHCQQPHVRLGRHY